MTFLLFKRLPDSIFFKGRDFSGEVISCGVKAADLFSRGEDVWGVALPTQQGTHGDFAVVSSSTVEYCH